MTPINLIPRRRVESRAARRRVRAWVLGGLIYSLAICIACFALRFSVAAATPGWTGTDDDMARITARISETAREARKVAKETTDLQGRLDSARTVGCHPDWSILLNALASRRGAEIVLESIEIVPTKLDTPAPAAHAAPTTNAPAAHGTKPEPEPEPAQALDAFSVRIAGLARKPGQPFAFARELEHLGVLDQVRIKEVHTQKLGSLDTVRFDLTALIADRPEGAPR